MNTNAFDEMQRNVVLGYMRNIQLLFPKYNIPPLVIHTILLFYHITEEFIQDFDDKNMNLSEDLLRGIYTYGWEKPFTAQRHGLIPIIQRNDTIIEGDSGTGKSGTYSIAALHRLDIKECQCQMLVLTPTRELSTQINSILKSLGSYLGATTRACIGGVSSSEDIKELSKGVQIVVSTPGRMHDMILRKALSLNALQLFVLDQMDQMLDRGFQESIYSCFQSIPSVVQVVVNTACTTESMPVFEILQFCEKCMRNTLHLVLHMYKALKHYYGAVEKEDCGLTTLHHLFEALDITQTIIYVNTRRKAIWLIDRMGQIDPTTSVLHGDMLSSERDLVMRNFHRGAIHVLMATDIFSCAFNNCEVSLVINYDLPGNKQSYANRSCRHERTNKVMQNVINFVCDEEEPQMREIELFFNITMDECR
eukprot:51601_1